MWRVLFALLALPLAARAAVPETPPRPSGEAHSCTQFYPPNAFAGGAEGTTTLSFHVSEAGATKDVAVAKTSGNADLDTAAILCVSGWRYEPASSDGKPVEVPWQANVQWHIATDAAVTPPRPADAHVCRNYPHGALWGGAQGRATVSFHVMPDGTVAKPAILKSTGDDDLDAAAASCVMAWHYKPALRDGTPVEAEWEAGIEWATHRPTTPVKGPCSHYASVTPALLAGIAGVTRLTLRILPDGSLSEVAVLRTSGSDVLDKAALQCVGEMHFDVARATLPPTGVAKTISIDWHADLPPG